MNKVLRPSARTWRTHTLSKVPHHTSSECAALALRLDSLGLLVLHEEEGAQYNCVVDARGYTIYVYTSICMKVVCTPRCYDGGRCWCAHGKLSTRDGEHALEKLKVILFGLLVVGGGWYTHAHTY